MPSSVGVSSHPHRWPKGACPWAAGRQADFPRFLALADDLGLQQVGRAGNLFLSVGA